MFMSFTEKVNLMIGTAGSGHAIPGPQHPHGMIKLSPDTISLPCAGYDYNDGRMIGFSHTHLEGVGGSGGRGNILLTGTTGPLMVDEREYASRFSHEDEKAEVGYYQVRLLDYDVNVELAASAHCGFHRYTFPGGKESRILLDLGHTLGGWNLCTNAEVHIVDKTHFAGFGTGSSSETFVIYFYGEVNIPWKSWGMWNGDEIRKEATKTEGSKIGLYLGYGTPEDGLTVKVKLAFSYINIEKAKKHLEKELPHWELEKTAAETRALWEELLGRVEIDGHSPDYQIQFYSALYRSFNQPTDYTEYDEYMDGVDGRKVYPSERKHFYSDDWAIWDTFRTTHPLQNILETERGNDQVQTMTRIYEHGGWLPMCTSPAAGYNQTMIGHNASSIIADALAAGYTDFDREKAFAAMKKQAREAHPDPKLRMLGTHPLYLEKGYMPHDAVEGKYFSVSETLEYVYGDWCVAKMAEHLGRKEEAEEFKKRAMNYQNLFDPALRFMRPRLGDGSFVEPFDPTDAFKRGFCETSSWEYTFFVPHDIQGLINLIGGDDAFTRRLDEFFEKKLYNNQNETGIQTPFLYNYARKPWKTQKIVTRYVREYHRNRPGGLYGEDDAGAMSAWYVFASMGLYPVCPGQGSLVITSPNFERIRIRVKGGDFIIHCRNFAPENIYIQAALLNGRDYNRSWISYEEFFSGGTLELIMGPSPCKSWGADSNSVPPSLTTETPMLLAKTATPPQKIAKSGEIFFLKANVVNKGATGAGTIKVCTGGLLGTRNIAGEISVFLPAGESRDIEIPCTIYASGTYQIFLQDRPIGELTVQGDDFYHFICEEKPKLSAVMQPNLEPVTVSARVRNKGSVPGTEAVCLTVNGHVEAAKPFTLSPGEEKEISFLWKPEAPGTYRLEICGSPIVEYDAAETIAHDFHTYSTTPLAHYHGMNRNLYIKAAGFQGKYEYGILFYKHPYEGDFEAVVAISYEENTNPYAGAGIIVKNDMASVSTEGCLFLGAMSVRGYFFNWTKKEAGRIAHPEGPMDCPKVPYWFRLRKKGKNFSGSYSVDGSAWVSLGEVDYPDAANKQFVGLFAQSGSELPRLVKFAGFSVKRL
jgi:predicted alpha-1,2-mannosidase